MNNIEYAILGQIQADGTRGLLDYGIAAEVTTWYNGIAVYRDNETTPSVVFEVGCLAIAQRVVGNCATGL